MASRVKVLSIVLVTLSVVAMATSQLNAQAYYRPVTTYYPPASYAPVVVQTQPSYLPQITNQVVWQQVPVTTYRQVLSVNPWTGLQNSSMQPSTTMQWRSSQRVVTTNRPMYVDPLNAVPQIQSQRAPVTTYQSQPTGTDTTTLLRDANRAIISANKAISDANKDIGELRGEIRILKEFVFDRHAN